MRNTTYAFAILLCAALAALMTGCAMPTEEPEPTFRHGYFIMDAYGDEMELALLSGGKSNVKITSDGLYAIYLNNNNELVRHEIASDDSVAFSLPFDAFDYYPSYDVIYIHGRTGENWDIYSMDLMTGDLTNLTNIQAQERIQFFIDYAQHDLYFSHKPDSLHTLYRLNIDTSELTALASNSYDAYREFGVSADDGAVYYFHTTGDSLDGMYRLDIQTEQARQISTAYPMNTLQVGVDEAFVLWGGGVIWLDANHEPDGGGGGYSPWLLSNRTDIVYSSSPDIIYRVNVLTGVENSMTSGCFLWVSVEGDLIIFERFFRVD